MGDFEISRAWPNQNLVTQLTNKPMPPINNPIISSVIKLFYSKLFLSLI